MLCRVAQRRVPLCIVKICLQAVPAELIGVGLSFCCVIGGIEYQGINALEHQQAYIYPCMQACAYERLPNVK